MGAKILIVEDVMMIAGMLRDILQHAGYAVVGPATNVEQAIALIGSMHIDAAIVDINLNGVMSYPAIDALVAYEVPFVIVTAYGRSGMLEAYRHHTILQKPYPHTHMRTLIAELLLPAKSAGRLSCAVPIGSERPEVRLPDLAFHEILDDRHNAA